MQRGAYKELEWTIGYRFRDKALLEMAVTHPSYRFESEGVEYDNQRLEFLGDAVLDLLLAESLYDALPSEAEGALTSARSRLASGRALAKHARRVGLGTFLRMGRGEEASGGRSRASSLADALEALIGAAYLDKGLKGARKLFECVFAPDWSVLAGDRLSDNPKGKLQEYAQAKWKRGPVYSVLKTEGPAHARVFSVAVRLPDGRKAQGTSGSKREAETLAAAAILKSLDADT